jgi:hypothetical protein
MTCDRRDARQAALLAEEVIEALRPGSHGSFDPAAADRYLTGVDRQWHAIDRTRAGRAPLGAAGAPAIALAACGTLARLAPEFGTYQRTSTPVQYDPCPRCAWEVAIATGTTGRELALLAPGGRKAAAIRATGADPMLAVSICTAILAAAEDSDYGLDHPATAGLLAHATRHRPLLLLPEDCAEDPTACEHRPTAAGDSDGWHCDYPDCTVACAACTAFTGAWAGEWEGHSMGQCTVTAPCSVLLALAAHYKIPARPVLAS